MRKSSIQVTLMCVAILMSCGIAVVMTPRTMMAQAASSLDLETLIPRQFGQWKPVPDIHVVEPPGSDTLSREIYNQEIARGYVDGEGHIVMLLIAYGISQSDRLQLHRPEVCYAAVGFRVSRPFGAMLAYRPDRQALSATRLVAQREGRLEPITYWMRIGHDVATGVVERQFLKVTYGLRGLIPDGALVRISTVGVPEGAAFEIQDRFIRDLLTSVNPSALKFLVGDATSSPAS